MNTINTSVAFKEQWKDLINADGVDAIAESKQEVCGKIFAIQHKAILEESAFRDEKLAEAFGSMIAESQVGGDHGYNATNIASGNASGAVTQIGPAVMGMVRRAIPNLMAFDVAGVQPLTSPTGQIFSLRAVYGNDPLAVGAKEAFHPMFGPDVNHSGVGSTKTFAKVKAGDELTIGTVIKHEFAETGTAYLQVAANTLTVDAAATTAEALDAAILKLISESKIAEIGEAMATSLAELQEGVNGTSDNAWSEMGFRIDKQAVEAKSRQLKAQYSIELAQDLRAVHGIDADAELTGILATEIMLEINREIVNWINATAQIGKTGFTRTVGSTAGVFDLTDTVDTKGARWQGEAFKAFLFQVDKEATEIGRQTGRGAGNFIIASRNVVNVFASIDSGVTPAVAGLTSGLNADTSKSVFAGVLGGRYKVYIDQYAREDYFTVGYKGTSQLDAGIYYNPYVALTPLRGQDPKSLQPIAGFKTRYAIGINPLADSYAQAPRGRITTGTPTADSFGKNAYFRKVRVKGI